MAEWINFLNSISPHVFAYATFVYTIGFLLKIIRDERRDKREELEKTRQILFELNKKMATVTFETKKTMDALLDNITQRR